MAEPFELVRTVRQHIRRSAQLLDAGNADEALVAIDAALALDPQSVAAQALRERIVTAKPAPARAAAAREGDRSSFVPQGVNAASWRGFEQRITERRFKALIDTVNTSISGGDAAAARAALLEARELRPDAPGLADFDRRVAAMPVALASQAAPAPRIWMRATGAAALFLVGVSLLLGLEWMRPGGGAAHVPAAPAIAPAVPASAPAPDASPAVVPNLGSVPVALNDDEASAPADESVAAIVTPPEPLIRPAATSGTAAEAVAPGQQPLRTAPARSVATRQVSPPIVPRSVPVASQSPEEMRPLPSTEVPDSYVAPRTVTAIPDAGPAVERSEPEVDTPVTADARDVAAPAATMASAVTIPPTVDQQLRVQEVLRQYARAYGQLDASAARAVWSTVDERALARAFQNLSSQRVSFDECDIDVRGVIANASCRGQLSYAPKVGNREPRTEQRTWRFELRRQGDSWTIVNHDVSRAPTE
jgi:hypothetical protein